MAAVVAKVSGPQTIGALIDQFAAAMDTVSAGHQCQRARAKTNRLSDTIRLSLNDAFFTAHLERAVSERPKYVPILCDLIAYHGTDLNGEALQIGAERPRVVDLLARWGHQLCWLPDPRFGIEAAWVLVDIWRRQNEPEEAKRFRVGRDYSSVMARRAQLGKPERPPKTSDASEAIFKAVQAIGRPDADPKLRVRALQLAAAGLRIPHGGKQREIAARLALPGTLEAKARALDQHGFAGRCCPRMIYWPGSTGFSKQERQSPGDWRTNTASLIVRWSFLRSAIGRRPCSRYLTACLADNIRSSNLCSLLSALAESPNEDEAVDLLQVLAQRLPKLKQAYEWSNALTRIGTVKANLVLLDAVSGDQSDGQVRISERWRMAEVFAEAAQAFPSFRDAVMERHEHVGAGRVDEFTESILTKIGDEDCLLELIGRYASTQRTFDHILSGAVFNLAVERRPASDWPGAFEEFSVPLVNLRKTLFEMYTSGGPSAVLAGAALSKIDQLRDRHGRIDDEPRHPDLASGIPWPAEAGE